MKKSAHDGLRTWITIDRKAIEKNYRALRKLLSKDTMFMAVVKSNAYGHNIHEYAKAMEDAGADWLGVDSVTEAIAVRKSGVKIPVLILGFTLTTRVADVLRIGVSMTVSSIAQLDAIMSRAAPKKPLRLHVKVDTGMHRQGFQKQDAEALFARLEALRSRVIVEGLYTHFAEAKNPRSGDSTRRQLSDFEQWVKMFHDRGHDPIIHAAATGGAMLYPKAHFDMVRFGIGIYGLWPSSEAEHYLKRVIKLFPVLSWHTTIGEVKSVKRGERVGYDFTEMLQRDSVLAVLPVGYWHGIPRLLSSKGRVLISGRTARIVGRISMDMIVVDVTDIPEVAMGDEAIIIGKQGKDEIKASELAQFAATTHYEIVTRINPLIRRFYA